MHFIFGRYIPLIVLSLSSVAAVWAQSIPAANTAWQALNVRLTASPATGAAIATVVTPGSPSKSLDAGIPAAPVSTASYLIQTAKDAKSFYTKYPTDTRSKEAKKIEAVTLLQSAHHGAMEFQVDGLKSSDAFRADKKNSAHDRFDVALNTELLLLKGALKGKSLHENGPLAEQLGDRLAKEFGWTSDVIGYHQSLLRTGEATTVGRIATKLQAINVPAELKTEAAAWTRRQRQVGQSVGELEMLSSDKKLINFRTLQEVTVVYFWSPDGGTNDLQVLARLKPPSGDRLKWIYVGLGAEPKALKEVKAAAPYPGEFCFDGSALGSAAATAFGVTQTPQVVVIEKGKLRARGSLINLSSLLGTTVR